jgi:hypothetical protein
MKTTANRDHNASVPPRRAPHNNTEICSAVGPGFSYEPRLRSVIDRPAPLESLLLYQNIFIRINPSNWIFTCRAVTLHPFFMRMSTMCACPYDAAMCSGVHRYLSLPSGTARAQVRIHQNVTNTCSLRRTSHRSENTRRRGKITCKLSWSVRQRSSPSHHSHSNPRPPSSPHAYHHHHHHHRPASRCSAPVSSPDVHVGWRQVGDEGLQGLNLPVLGWTHQQIQKTTLSAPLPTMDDTRAQPFSYHTPDPLTHPPHMLQDTRPPPPFFLMERPHTTCNTETHPRSVWGS